MSQCVCDYRVRRASRVAQSPDTNYTSPAPHTQWHGQVAQLLKRYDIVTTGALEPDECFEVYTGATMNQHCSLKA